MTMWNEVRLSLLAHSPKIDLSKCFDAPRNHKQVGKFIAELLEEEPPTLTFAKIWEAFGGGNTDGFGGPKTSDPLTIYLTLPFAKTQDENVLYSVSLKHMVYECVALARDGNNRLMKAREIQKALADLLALMGELLDEVEVKL